ncbi:class I SAM-dependent methyltransferase [Candidatus Woesearchaeota archaeon]|nr:class I SAM-dependent methyltransferase [Candidatus Woesearchaeota archaeon]
MEKKFSQVARINRKSRMLIFEKLAELELPKNCKMLDAGCGDGSFLFELQEKGYFNIHGCDMDEKGFVPNDIKFKKANFHQKLPYHDHEFDVVFSLEVIEHLENPWFFMDELHRIIRPHGHCVLTTPNPDNITSKILFLLMGRFNHFGHNLSYEFNEAVIRKDKHRTPIFHFFFQEMVYKRFIIITYWSNGLQPIFKGKEIDFKTKSPLIGADKIYFLKKRE